MKVDIDRVLHDSKREQSMPNYYDHRWLVACRLLPDRISADHHHDRRIIGNLVEKKIVSENSLVLEMNEMILYF